MFAPRPFKTRRVARSLVTDTVPASPGPNPAPGTSTANALTLARFNWSCVVRGVLLSRPVTHLGSLVSEVDRIDDRRRQVVAGRVELQPVPVPELVELLGLQNHAGDGNELVDDALVDGERQPAGVLDQRRG